MKYYKISDEIEGDYGVGDFYLEIDEERDMVVRQVEIYEYACFRGRWTGTSLEGRITDQKVPVMSLPARKKEISAEEFEAVWNKLNKK